MALDRCPEGLLGETWMNIWRKLFGRSPSSAGPVIHVAEIETGTAAGTSILVKGTFLDPAISEYEKRLEAAHREQGVPYSPLSRRDRDDFIVQFVVGLGKQENAGWATADDWFGSSVDEVDDCSTIYESDLAPEWKVAGYWVQLFRAP